MVAEIGKGGPPQKIGPKEKTEVIAILRAGGSMRDAADIIGVDYATLYRMRQNDIEFANGVRKAVKEGKLRQIKKVRGAKDWRAAAWYLERRWGSEYGRHDHVDVTSKGEPVFTLAIGRPTGDQQTARINGDGQHAN
jgi:hypothetical protein